MMRKFMVLMTIFLLSLGCQISEASPIKFVNTIPENGSEITTFDIKFKFDISTNIEEQGTDNVGVGHTGYYAEGYDSNICTFLYEGTPENGKLLAISLTSSFKGSAESKDIIDLSFPTSIVPEAGKTYTVVCNNSFSLYNLGTNKKISGTVLNWQNDPQTFTFVGKQASSSDLIFQKSNISEGQSLASIRTIDFEFNEDIAISQVKEVQIWSGENIIASSKSIEIDPENGKALRATFDEVTLYLGNEYSIRLAEGIVSLKSGASVLNKPVEIKVNGTSTIRLSTKSVSPENNSTVLPDKAVIRFNLENGQTLTPPQGVQHERGIDFFKGEISDENFISTLLGTASGDGISWDLSTFQFEPETIYFLHKKADDISVWYNGKPQPAYGNEEVIITFTTPSIEAAGFTPMEFDDATIFTSVDSSSSYKPDMEVPYISTFATKIKNWNYIIGNTTYYLITHPDRTECALYEVTPEGDKLIKSYDFYISEREYDKGFYNLASLNMTVTLYEGKKYKFVIPEGYFTVYPKLVALDQQMDLSKANYIKSKEMVFTFTGTTPSKAVLLGCNVENNAQVSELYKVVWTFDGEYRLNDNINTIQQTINTGLEGMKPSVSKKTPVFSYLLGKSYLTLDYISNTTGKPTTISKGTTYTLTIPKGMLVNVVNDEVVNDEIVLTIKGGAEAEPETVWMNMTINSLHTSSHKATKGKSYTFSLNPGKDWKVKSVKNGEDVVSGISTDKNNPNIKTYILSALKGDTNINAELEYDGQWASNDSTSGIEVWEIKDKNIRIYGDSDHIVVDGVTPENTICVYNIAGMLINSTRVSDGNDRVLISVPLGPTYIVTVDGFAAKIMMKKN